MDYTESSRDSDDRGRLASQAGPAICVGSPDTVCRATPNVVHHGQVEEILDS